MKAARAAAIAVLLAGMMMFGAWELLICVVLPSILTDASAGLIETFQRNFSSQ